ncbi:tyrosine-type recombinase/integrase [Lysobacter enzymogenes]|uniref:tyrosine-type recombinase/integrase n=1 Tax=Lysobacter enzymogenes TaxID=69 RepID=UPI001A96775D|nr:site-specific integrase [Lysobacter enzymogenes]QQP96491.1 site-specific integrase [Lysobacter enzymogenes]QQP96559.1 site-specific integrase [Lysobacter enzymogenes]
MASIRPRSGAWRAEVYVNGVRESVTRPTKREATAWAQSREAELAGAKLPDHTVRDALRRYAREVCPTHKGRQWEEVRLKAMERDPIAGVRLPVLKASDVADWKQRRLAKVSPASVARELNLLRSVLEEARREWVWLYGNPAKDVKRPATPASRKRRISPDEIDRVTLACGLEGLEARTASQRVGLAFLFALETAMRAGEILGLRWADIRGKAAVLPQTKNGDQREVPLSARAREILGVLNRSSSTVFDLDVRSRDVLWRRARDAAEVGDLHFHDSRAEAIWRLSKKLDVMELARVIGHRDLRSLMIYYQTSADELADRL